MIIARGAEAILYKQGNSLVKERIKKSYRIGEIDLPLRKQRTRKEAKILEKLSFSPKLIKLDEKNFKIEMEFIEGKTLNDSINEIKDKQKIFTLLGKQIEQMHNQNIIHGDLTTSNMLLKENKLFFIDFGLSFISDKIEDKAVDLHLLKQCLNSKHYQYSELFNYVLNGYSNHEVLARLKKVQARGRYKNKNGA